MKTTGFGYFLRDSRQNGKISLRKLAKDTDLDPAYLSRVEREMSPAPRQEIVQRIADALCRCQKLPTAECERLKRDLLDAAGQLTNEDDLIEDLSHRFADRLRERGMAEPYVLDAVKKVPLDQMRKVLRGEEPLEIEMEASVPLEAIAARESRGEEVISLCASEAPSLPGSASDYINQYSSEFKSRENRPRKGSRADERKRFRAGTRAFIEVEGDLTSSQEEQLRSIATLVRSILKEK